MIIEGIISVMAAAVGLVFQAFGVLPDMPVAITNVTDAMQQYTVTGIAVIFGIFGKAFTVAVFTTIVTLIFHHQIWSMVTWVYHKIRG